MVIQLNRGGEFMVKSILQTIEQLYNGDFGYILMNYVDKNIWFNKMTQEMKELHVENLTDFNYSKCFTLYITSSTHPEVSTDEFIEYISQHTYLNGLLVYISAIGPFAAIKYVRYEYVDGNVGMREQYEPFDKETEQISKDVFNLLDSRGIRVLEKNILDIEVPNISLELKEENVTIFHCLFEDSY